jgi:NAD(P)H-dependent FMN reductase
MKILAIPGSLRANSSSNAVLQVIASMMPEKISFTIYEGIGALPHFNDPQETPSRITDFRNHIRQADAVLICTPEYAFGVPGSLKNALDWTVASGEFIDKPVSLITASSQGEKGHAALLLILTAISARVIDGASLLIPFVRAKLDEKGLIKDPNTKASLLAAVQILIQDISRNSSRTNR